MTSIAKVNVDKGRVQWAEPRQDAPLQTVLAKFDLLLALLELFTDEGLVVGRNDLSSPLLPFISAQCIECKRSEPTWRNFPS